jgi:hypothetical protein
MIDDEAERDAVWQALNLAFYALCDQLEANGAINQDAVADQMARFDAGHNDRLAANVRGIIETLRARPFAMRGPCLGVIEGGKVG